MWYQKSFSIASVVSSTQSSPTTMQLEVTPVMAQDFPSSSKANVAGPSSGLRQDLKMGHSSLVGGSGSSQDSSCDGSFASGFLGQSSSAGESISYASIEEVYAARDFMVARKDFAIGERVLVEKPIIALPNYTNGYVYELFVKCLGCCSCMDCSEMFQLCSRCGWPICSTKCEWGHGSKHADNECVIFAVNKVQPYIAFYNYVGLLRCLLMTKTNPLKWSQLMSLRDGRKYVDDATKKDAVDFIQNVCGRKEYTEEIIHGVTDLIYTSRIKFPCKKDSSTGYLYTSGPKIKHSCLPNCSWIILDNGLLRLTAMEEIRQGDQITCSYTNLPFGTLERRRVLELKYNFICKCQLCCDRTELGLNFSGMRCPTCYIGILLPQNPLDVNSCWICNRSEYCSAEETGHLIAVSVRAIELALMARPAVQLGLEQVILEMSAVETLIAHYESEYQALHRNHYLLYGARSRLLAACDEAIANTNKKKLWTHDLMHHAEWKMIANCMVKHSKICLEVADILWPGVTQQRGVLLQAMTHGEFILKQVKMVEAQAASVAQQYEEIQEQYERTREVLVALPKTATSAVQRKVSRVLGRRISFPAQLKLNIFKKIKNPKPPKKQ